MAKEISSLAIRLGANVAPFVGGMRSASASTNGFVSSLKNIGKGAASIIAGIGAYELLKRATRALYNNTIGLVNAQLDLIDINAKLSDRLGITTEALGGLQHAADLSGVSTEALSGGLEKYLKNVGEAVNGNKTARAAFQSLGLDFAALANMSTDRAIGTIGDALNAIQNPAQRAAAAVAIFGKSGQGLLPLLAEGSSGIEAMIREAAALGLTFSRIDAAKVEEANDAFSRMKAAIAGIGKTLAIAFAPALKTVANMFIKFGIIANSVFKRLQPHIERASSWVANRFVGAIQWGMKITRAWAGAWASLGRAIASIVKAAWVGIRTLAGLFGVDLNNSVNSARDTIKGMGGVFVAVLKGLVIYFTTISVIIENWKLVFKLTIKVIHLTLVGFVEDFKHFFTTALPTYIVYFAENFKRVFANMMNYGGRVFNAMMMFLRGEATFEWIGHEIKKGFDTAFVGDLKIPDRIPTDTEKSLKEEAAALAGELGKTMKDRINEAMKDIELPSLDFTAKGRGLWGGMFDFGKRMANAMKPLEEKGRGLWGGLFNAAKLAIDTREAESKISDVSDQIKNLSNSPALLKVGSADAMLAQAQAKATLAIMSIPPSAAPRPEAQPISEHTVREVAKTDEKNNRAMLEQLKKIVTELAGADRIELSQIA